jgi:hypothetical protein
LLTESDSNVTLVAGASAASGGGHVVLVADTGAITTLPGGWTYVAPGVISLVSPSSGQHGAVVTISGSGLLGGDILLDRVLFGGIVALASAGTDARVTATVAPRGAAALVDVTVVADSGARVTASGAFQYLTPGQVSSFTATSGQVGTLVTVLGSNLRGDAAAVASVTLAGLVAEIVSETDSQVLVRIPAGAAASSTVVLTASTGALVQSATVWTYVSDGVVTSVTSSSGQFGTSVTIGGVRLRGSGLAVSRVRLGGVEATLVAETNTQVIVRAGAGAATVGNVSVVLESSSGALVSIADA